MNSTVYALTAIGTDLYVGGAFTTAGGVSANKIAKWNGTNWSALGSGMNSTVYALTAIGTDLYAGGFFSSAGGVSASRIAKWNGTSWSALGSGMDSTVSCPNGDRRRPVCRRGSFTTAGGVPASRIAKWNGTGWSALGSGVNNQVNALAVIGADLYAGGFFTTAGGKLSSRIAQWREGGFCPSLGTAPSNVTIVNSTCNVSCVASGGSITAPTGTPCPTGSALQYSVDEGVTWLNTLPEYNQSGPAQGIQTRCRCETDGSMVSPASIAENTAPATCTQVSYYTDADGDGYGTGVGQSLCANPGAGYTTQAMAIVTTTTMRSTPALRKSATTMITIAAAS